MCDTTDDGPIEAIYDSVFLRREKEKARALRKSAWWRRKCASGICHYCRQNFSPKELTMDHKVPLSRGGRSVKENLVPCCKNCNNQKSNLLPSEWALYLEKIQPRK